MRILWRPDDALIQLVAMLDVKVPEARRAAVYETLGLINERLWIGHFEMWASEGDLLFRHAVLLDPDAPPLSRTRRSSCWKSWSTSASAITRSSSSCCGPASGRPRRLSSLLDTVGEA
ncbi:YbjN domain-containing protein [Hankyongella ginsenosidimutans]|uniref:YbjN domain-containing protein n=1 Tax=Hankyongella ginsenosidimutans TaxID=1763828 RepID=UPI00319DCBD5